MRLPRRVFLNPCDYLLYTDHIIRMRRAQGPNVAYMCMEIDGTLDREHMRRSIIRAMALSPTTLARLRMSFFGGWPFWRLPRDPHAAAEAGIDRAYRFVDASESDAALDGALATTGESPTDFRDGPQVCMTHYALAEGRSRVCIRWPHWLMDAAGTLAFLETWATCYADCAEALPPVEPSDGDVRQWRPLKGVSLRERWRVMRAQPKGRERSGLRVGVPCDDGAEAVAEHRVLHHCWDAAAMERIRLASKRAVPAGPARITRYLGVCVLRALDALFEENGWGGDAYRVTLPMRVRGEGASEAPPMMRFGNYLVSPLLVFDRAGLRDGSALAESLTSQLQTYLDNRGDAAQWSLMSLAGLLPFIAHRWIFGLRMFTAHFSSGFSFYAELHPPLRHVGGMPITNLWGGGPTTVPPGMNPVFSRFDKSLNLALTYSWPVVSDELARRYAALIEAEALK